MQPKAIHQFHSGSAYGDAITNAMLLIRDFLRSCGLESRIFVEHIAPELKNELEHFSEYPQHPDNVLLYHHSLGHDRIAWLTGLPDQKVLIYHNITPAEFFPAQSPGRYYAELGRRQLAELKDLFAGAVAVSDYNLQELAALGYTPARTIPFLFDPERIRSAQCNWDLYQDLASSFNILFVGRLAQHKGQQDLIQAFAAYHRVQPCPSRLCLVGAASSQAYLSQLQDLIRRQRLQHQVHLPGLVSDQDLYAYYQAADLFVCLSEHEGFCIPLLEAMLFNVPVLAYQAGAVPDTLNGSGLLLQKKDPPTVGALLSLLARSRPLRSRLITTYAQSLAPYARDKIQQDFISFMAELGFDLDTKPSPSLQESEPGVSFQLEGPFDSSYSLALVNRQTALALEEQHPGQVALYPTDGPGDYLPDPGWLRSNPRANELYQKSSKAPRERIILRNLYPPRIVDARGRLNILSSYAWEESAFPVQELKRLNCSLDGVAVVSSFVRKVLVDNGLQPPVGLSPNAADHIVHQEPQPVHLDLPQGFRFLHVSSGFPRKGLDVLLQAFMQVFQAQEKVSLIIKTFANEHNTVWEQLRAVQHDFPAAGQIQVINQDFSPGQMRWLYSQCHCLVAPSRGEGFGLPLAEAMALDIPVITTGYGGQRDFCTPDTAWLIDYCFARARTHMQLFDSVWAEPDAEHLGRLMREVYESPGDELARKTAQAKQLILSEYTWARTAARLSRFVDYLQTRPLPEPGPLRLGWVSTWNCRCGIAEYSHSLAQNLDPAELNLQVLANQTQDLIRPDQDYVHRVWQDCSQKDLSGLLVRITELELDAVLIQFNFGFFHLPALEGLIHSLKDQGLTLLITLHSVQCVQRPDFQASLSWISGALARCDRLLVHSIKDLNLLKGFSLLDNVTLWPHGVRQPNAPAGPGQGLEEPILACYGFLLPHKGILELIQAVDILRADFPGIKLELVNALYPAPESEQYLEKCRELTKDLGLESRVSFHSDFLPEEQCLQLLSRAGLIVFPYQQTAESSSAAVRFGLAADRPVLCTPLDIFQDVSEVVFQARGTEPGHLAESIQELLLDPQLACSLDSTRSRWLQEHAWPYLGQRLSRLIRSLHREQPSA